MQSGNAKTAVARFKVGDRVRIKNFEMIFYTRIQAYTRGVCGTVVALTHESLIPEDEAWNREDGRPERFYIVRFRQKDLWDDYPFEYDTLQTEFSDRWLELAES